MDQQWGQEEEEEEEEVLSPSLPLPLNPGGAPKSDVGGESQL